MRSCMVTQFILFVFKFIQIITDGLFQQLSKIENWLDTIGVLSNFVFFMIYDKI